MKTETAIVKRISLQKLTIRNRIEELLDADKPITKDDICGFKQEDFAFLIKAADKRLSALQGIDRDLFITKISFLLSDDTKNQLWESNHNRITATMSNLIHDLKRMPSINEIANGTDLSRQTVYKHLSEYGKHPLQLQQIEHFKFLANGLLAKVFHYAAEGDMAAAKLYFKVVGYLNDQSTPRIGNQNNYIQINGLQLSQDTIQRLNPEQLKSIENIIRTIVPISVNNEILQDKK